MFPAHPTQYRERDPSRRGRVHPSISQIRRLAPSLRRPESFRRRSAHSRHRREAPGRWYVTPQSGQTFAFLAAFGRPTNSGVRVPDITTPASFARPSHRSQRPGRSTGSSQAVQTIGAVGPVGQRQAMTVSTRRPLPSVPTRTYAPHRVQVGMRS